MKPPAKKTSQKLYEVAEAQQGFFTTKQAIASGYAENTHPYHIRVGNWMREYRGIYRLANFPSSEESDLVLWSLWSRNRQDVPQGVYSHETALSIHDLSDVMPLKLHMTVPQAFRRNSKIPDILILHRTNLRESDIEPRQGFRVTTALRAVTDLLREETVASDILKQALYEAMGRGLITHGDLKKVEVLPSIRIKIEALLQENAGGRV